MDDGIVDVSIFIQDKVRQTIRNLKESIKKPCKVTAASWLMHGRLRWDVQSTRLLGECCSDYPSVLPFHLIYSKIPRYFSPPTLQPPNISALVLPAVLVFQRYSHVDGRKR